MGIKFQRAKVIARQIGNQIIKQVVTYSDENKNPPLPPLIGITRFTFEGSANKQSISYTLQQPTENGIMTEYKTVWVPMGQEGWKVRIQCTLAYRPPRRRDGRLQSLDTEYSRQYDELRAWLTVDTGQLLRVESNQCDELGRNDPTRRPYLGLEQGTLWYVDKITFQTIKGVQHLTQMELILVRCWEA